MHGARMVLARLVATLELELATRELSQLSVETCYNVFIIKPKLIDDILLFWFT